ncbi:MAG TPA: hypothetical protein VGT98_16195 [Candidatus Elarobacter sp.]|nr:hypothetical protein [Candidatus Elarobacter sp.]HEV2739214.1 hypothetical protein [Candidatus Elarobacter sp.]
MSFRLAASVIAAALLCGCGGHTTSSTATAPAASAASSAVPAPAAPRPVGPANAPVPRIGQPGAIPLAPAERRELDATVAKAPPAERPRLRYALATGDDGKPHLVVYDGEGLGVTGRHPGKRHEYVVFGVLNATNGEHYDPQQNSIVAAIPPPPQRDVVPSKP